MLRSVSLLAFSLEAFVVDTYGEDAWRRLVEEEAEGEGREGAIALSSLTLWAADDASGDRDTQRRERKLNI